MYGAGRLESGNVREYEIIARSALESGHNEFCPALLTMAEVEWDHERAFRTKVESHRLARWLRPWPPIPEKSTIRETFAEFQREFAIEPVSLASLIERSRYAERDALTR
jgi:hypothetical protein